MSTPHNRANPGDFAKTVLMPGDPLRAKFIAETFLENPRLVTDVRGMLGYTGTYQGHPVSVMGSGMGMPSIGMQEKGFTIDPDSLDKLIEAAVFNLPEYIGLIETEGKPDTD